MAIYSLWATLGQLLLFCTEFAQHAGVRVSPPLDPRKAAGGIVIWTIPGDCHYYECRIPIISAVSAL